MSTTARIANNKLIIETDLHENPSRTQGGKGNNLMVAGGEGFIPTDVKIGGKTVKISINAVCKAD